MERKPIFDAVRKMLGRGFSSSEVDGLDRAIDLAMQQAGEQIAEEMGDTPEWLKLAAPLVERFEGLHRLIPGDKVAAYPDPATGGHPWTIGIGSTTDESGNPVREGDVWTVERARKRFEAHLREFAHQLDGILGLAPVTPQQKAALVSWVYNIGPHAARGSTLIRKHIAKDYAGAAKEFLRWNRAGGKVMRGLTRRREAEKKLYES